MAIHPANFESDWQRAQEIAKKHGLNPQYVFETITGTKASVDMGAKTVDDQELWRQAAQIRAARGGNLRQIFKALKDNPPAAGPAGTTATATQPAAAASDFMALVMSEKDRRRCSYRDAYLDCRKRFPQIFDAWLESVQG